MKYELVDGVKRHRESPSTFPIPPEEEKRGIKPGWFVRASFTNKGSTNGEKLWVEIDTVDLPNLKGHLRDTPIILDDLKDGDPVELELKHVLDITE